MKAVGEANVSDLVLLISEEVALAPGKGRRRPQHACRRASEDRALGPLALHW